MALRKLDGLGGPKGLGLRLPIGDLLHAALGIFIEGNFEPLDQIRPVALDEPRHVFRKMLGAFGDKIPKPRHHFITNFIGAAGVPTARLGDRSGGVTGK